MPFCQNCGKELQSDWNSCPFCSSKQYLSVSASIGKPNRAARSSYYTLGIVSILLGLLIFSTSSDESGGWITAFFVVGGVYMINATWMKSNTE